MGNPGEWEHGNSAVNGGLWMLRTEFRDMKALAVDGGSKMDSFWHPVQLLCSF